MGKYEQYYIKNKDRMIYVCGSVCDEKKPSVIIFGGVGWYMIGPNRIFIQLTEMCQRERINLFLFDYSGCGESSEDYKNIALESLISDSSCVLNYVRSIVRGNIYGIGYGIGNLVLKYFQNRNYIDYYIYYLPVETKNKPLLSYLTQKEIGVLKNRHQLEIDNNEKEKSELFRLFVGMLHDCSYNPVSSMLIKETFESNTAYGFDLPSIDRENTFIITDKIFTVTKADILYVKEFQENLTPNDWYKSPNLWPEILEYVNKKIVWWITHHTGLQKFQKTYCSITTKKELVFNNKMQRRQLFTLENETTLFGALHYPIKHNLKIPCAIFIPGLGGDKVDNFCCGPRLGDLMAQNNIAFIRYDNRYSGTSLLSLEDYNLSDIICDFREILRYVESNFKFINTNKIVLVSWSAGAQVANNVFMKMRDKIQGICYWNPVFLDNVKSDMNLGNTRYIKRKNGNYVTQIGGEYLGIKYLQDKKRYSPKEEFDNVDKHQLFIWSKGGTKSNEYEYAKDVKKNHQIIDTEGHLFSYDKMTEVFLHTIEWIREIIK